ncbi:single-stranded DNA-binding protein [Streptococcus fryi]
MINNVVLVGRMTSDADLKYTASNTATATFNLAVNRPFKNHNGEREVDFIRCVIWRQAAENLANWAKKGSLIGITGRIQTRNYDNQQGQRVYVTEVIADTFKLLESRGQQDNQGGNNQNGYPQQSYNNPQQTPNFASNQQTSFFQGQTTTPMDISDDDLPF